MLAAACPQLPGRWQGSLLHFAAVPSAPENPWRGRTRFVMFAGMSGASRRADMFVDPAADPGADPPGPW